MNSKEKEIINIYPQTTSLEHSEGINCWCEPEIEERENYIKIIHNTIWEIMGLKYMSRENQ